VTIKGICQQGAEGLNSSFAELGCAIPLSGGAQAYLAYAVRVSRIGFRY
jgi:hypothetical protein